METALKLLEHIELAFWIVFAINLFFGEHHERITSIIKIVVIAGISCLKLSSLIINIKLGKEFSGFDVTMLVLMLFYILANVYNLYKNKNNEK